MAWTAADEKQGRAFDAVASPSMQSQVMVSDVEQGCRELSDCRCGSAHSAVFAARCGRFALIIAVVVSGGGFRGVRWRAPWCPVAGSVVSGGGFRVAPKRRHRTPRKPPPDTTKAATGHRTEPATGHQAATGHHESRHRTPWSPPPDTTAWLGFEMAWTAADEKQARAFDAVASPSMQSQVMVSDVEQGCRELSDCRCGSAHSAVFAARCGRFALIIAVVVSGGGFRGVRWRAPWCPVAGSVVSGGGFRVAPKRRHRTPRKPPPDTTKAATGHRTEPATGHQAATGHHESRHRTPWSPPPDTTAARMKAKHLPRTVKMQEPAKRRR